MGVKPKVKRRSLKEFLAANGCFLCYIPERKEVEDAKSGVLTGKPAETKEIVKWLIEDCGYNQEVVLQARNSMGHHFFNHSLRTASVGALQSKKGGR